MTAEVEPETAASPSAAKLRNKMRLTAALRENLKRRKTQMRARNAQALGLPLPQDNGPSGSENG